LFNFAIPTENLLRYTENLAEHCDLVLYDDQHETVPLPHRLTGNCSITVDQRWTILQADPEFESTLDQLLFQGSSLRVDRRSGDAYLEIFANGHDEFWAEYWMDREQADAITADGDADAMRSIVHAFARYDDILKIQEWEFPTS
jgi:hypothetical protein